VQWTLCLSLDKSRKRERSGVTANGPEANRSVQFQLCLPLSSLLHHPSSSFSLSFVLSSPSVNIPVFAVYWGSYGGGPCLSFSVFSFCSGPTEPRRLSTITLTEHGISFTHSNIRAHVPSFQPSAGDRNSDLSVDVSRWSTRPSPWVRG